MQIKHSSLGTDFEAIVKSNNVFYQDNWICVRHCGNSALDPVDQTCRVVSISSEESS